MDLAVAAILGIDVGTTAVKAVVVRPDGSLLAESELQQQVDVPRPGWAEQNPEVWWANSRKVIMSAMAKARRSCGSVELRAIGLSGQMHSAAFLDADGEVIRPALLWNDMRTTSQCHEIASQVGFENLRKTVGNLALEGFTAPKVLWLQQNEPFNYAQLRAILLAKDYVRYCLTGEVVTDYSDAAGTLFFDIRKLRWSSEILENLGISSAILPEIVRSTDISGILLKSLVAELGLGDQIPVFGGGADNAAGAVGSGVIHPGVVQASIGTSGTLLTSTKRAVVDRYMRLHSFCHCVPDLWYVMGVVLSAGESLRWLHDVLFPTGTSKGYEILIAEAESVEPGSSGLFFQPYLAGERTPHNDSNARGVFYGLHLKHTRAHLVRAVMEGVCFAMRDSMELMLKLQGDFSEVRAVGGGARGRFWRQMQADVYGTPVVTIGPASGPSYGAAMMAAVGMGEFASIAEAVNVWLYPEETVEPDPKRMGLYTDLYLEYRRLYPALKNRFASTARLVERGYG